jgi:hypothetical protein
MQELPTDNHCVGRWYLPTMNTQTWSPANEFLAGTFQEHFMKLVLPMSFETDYRREVVC